MALHIEKTTKSKISSVDFNNLKFGQIFTDHMFECDYENGAWQTPKIRPYQSLAFDPSAKVFHYGQAVFEGMKALVKLSQASLVTLNVTDMFGRQLHQKEVSAVDGMNTIDIDISTLNTGVYFLVTKVEGSSKLTKFIVQ